MANATSKCCGGVIKATIQLEVQAPLKQKGGGLEMMGIIVSQAQVKEKWLNTPLESQVMICSACKSPQRYVAGKGVLPTAEVLAAQGEDNDEESDSEGADSDSDNDSDDNETPSASV